MGNRSRLGRAQTRRRVWRMRSKNPDSSRGGVEAAWSRVEGVGPTWSFIFIIYMSPGHIINIMQMTLHSWPDQLTEKHTFSRSRQIFLNEMELEEHSTCPFGKKLLKLVCLSFSASPSKNCAKHTADKPLISFPS